MGRLSGFRVLGKIRRAPPWLRRLTLVWASALFAASYVVITAGPAVGANVLVGTEAEYRQALADLSSDSSGPHTITLTADITFTSGGGGSS